MAKLLAVVLVASGVWTDVGGTATAPVGAPVSSPETYRYDPEPQSGWWGLSGEYPVSLSEDGQSVGFLNVPAQGTFARGGASLLDDGVYWYGVADGSPDAIERDLRLMDASAVVAPYHPGESQLSGDALTYVATYRAERYSPGDCDDRMVPVIAPSYYWETQVLGWTRLDRNSEFGEPELVSVSDPVTCDGVPAEFGPDLIGVGGDGASEDPSVSDDGSVIAFSSQAENLGASPVADVAALFVAEEDGSGQLVPEMVTPTSLNGDVWDPMISGDGDHIVFVSDASGLVSGVSPPSGGSLVYVATRTGPSSSEECSPV